MIPQKCLGNIFTNRHRVFLIVAASCLHPLPTACPSFLCSLLIYCFIFCFKERLLTTLCFTKRALAWFSQLLSPNISSTQTFCSFLSRWEEERAARGLWHRHGKPRDREGRRGDPVAVQEIPEKETGRQVLELRPAATSSLMWAWSCMSIQTAPSWTEKKWVGWVSWGGEGSCGVVWG